MVLNSIIDINSRFSSWIYNINYKMYSPIRLNFEGELGTNRNNPRSLRQFDSVFALVYAPSAYEYEENSANGRPAVGASYVCGVSFLLPDLSRPPPSVSVIVSYPHELGGRQVSSVLGLVFGYSLRDSQRSPMGSRRPLGLRSLSRSPLGLPGKNARTWWLAQACSKCSPWSLRSHALSDVQLKAHMSRQPVSIRPSNAGLRVQPIHVMFLQMPFRTSISSEKHHV